MPLPIAPAPITATSASRGNAALTSAARESRRALLEECRHALAVIPSETQLALEIAFEIELLIERVAG
jgi:hypothetical protein